MVIHYELCSATLHFQMICYRFVYIKTVKKKCIFLNNKLFSDIQIVHEYIYIILYSTNIFQHLLYTK